ncbi:hypothetical protein HGRIS_008740 [Hohenbuehelia grisea]|uniref:Zn(2)-C6 fungal-type domain-containing protein n=1 Tax=Hohenbuehelia grisea TaxID=104357 RepID=A0ABR3J8X9_9AGAR
MAGSKEKNDQKPRRKPGRVPTSCAECRRLKLRCDRNVPCEKCVNRGCGSICPDGCLTAGKGNRLILANTEELHDRIDTLCGRIRELEDALRLLQASVSDEQHPLLREDRIFSKTSPEQPSVSSSTTLPSPAPSNSTPSSNPPPTTRSQPETPAKPQPPQTQPQTPTPSSSDAGEEDNIIDAFGMDAALGIIGSAQASLGTLTITHRGETSFLGQTARSEYLIRALAKPRAPYGSNQPRLSSRVVEATSHCQEIEVAPDEALKQEVIAHLPMRDEAIRLCSIYLEYGKFLFSPVTSDELYDDILDVAYRAQSVDSVQSSHTLSLLYAILAIASLFDTSRPPFAIDSHEYYILSRAALTICSPFIHTTLPAIQALMHSAQYLDLAEVDSIALNTAWGYIGMAVRLGHSIGLRTFYVLFTFTLHVVHLVHPDLNSTRWNLPPDVIQRRSRVFWQLVSLDTWTSFGLGRPPILSTQYMDCEFPKDTEEVVNQLGRPELGFHSWCWRYTALLQTVIATAFIPKAPRYLTILELDRKVRDFHVPLHLRPDCKHGSIVAEVSHVLQMQRWYVMACKENTLLHLHRGYFAQALHEQSNNITKHKYGPSVLATYRSAWRLIESVRLFWRLVPQLLGRAHLAWSHSLSAAIVMCLLVTRAPASSFTITALDQLDKLRQTFEEASQTCRFARNNVDAIRTLHDKARAVLDQSHAPEVSTITPAELDRLGGKTHLIATTAPPAPAPARPPSPAPLLYLAEPQSELYNGIGMPSNGVEGDAPMAANMHPTIAADMHTLDVGMPLFNDIFDIPAEPMGQSMHPGAMSLDSVPGFVDHVFGSTNGMGGNVNVNGMGFPMSDQPSPPPFNETPVLWQSFIEQLGF